MCRGFDLLDSFTSVFAITRYGLVMVSTVLYRLGIDDRSIQNNTVLYKTEQMFLALFVQWGFRRLPPLESSFKVVPKVFSQGLSCLIHFLYRQSITFQYFLWLVFFFKKILIINHLFMSAAREKTSWERTGFNQAKNKGMKS